MKKILLISLFLVSTILYSQRLQPGYYITEAGERISCELELKNWISWDNETLSVWKGGIKELIPISNIKEFGAGDNLKFITTSVSIEKSSDDLETMSTSSEPQFVIERVLLKVIVEGNYSLYEYFNEGVQKFFYKKRDSELKQLVYFRFFVNDEKSKVGANKEYIEQLKEINTCDDTKYLNTSYELNSLEKYFLNLNECANTPISFSRKKALKAGFEFDVFAGVNTATFESRRLFSDNNFDGNVTSLTFGVNAKYRIPLGANSVSLGVDVSYNSFDSSEEVVFSNFSDGREVEIFYSDLLFGFEGEYNIYTAEDQQLHFGAGIYLPVLLDDITYTESLTNLEFTSDSSSGTPAAIIVGYTIGRLDFNIHYFLGTQNLFSGVNNFNVDLNRKFSFRLQYQFL